VVAAFCLAVVIALRADSFASRIACFITDSSPARSHDAESSDVPILDGDAALPYGLDDEYGLVMVRFFHEKGRSRLQPAIASAP
jgi:hypothetical protein